MEKTTAKVNSGEQIKMHRMQLEMFDMNGKVLHELSPEEKRPTVVCESGEETMRRSIEIIRAEIRYLTGGGGSNDTASEAKEAIDEIPSALLNAEMKNDLARLKELIGLTHKEGIFYWKSGDGSKDDPLVRDALEVADDPSFATVIVGIFKDRKTTLLTKKENELEHIIKLTEYGDKVTISQHTRPLAEE